MKKRKQIQIEMILVQKGPFFILYVQKRCVNTLKKTH